MLKFRNFIFKSFNLEIKFLIIFTSITLLWQIVELFVNDKIITTKEDTIITFIISSYIFYIKLENETLKEIFKKIKK